MMKVLDREYKLVLKIIFQILGIMKDIAMTVLYIYLIYWLVMNVML